MTAELRQVYNEILRDVRKRIKVFMEDYENLPYYKQLQAQQARELEKEVLSLLNGVTPKTKQIIDDFKGRELTAGYNENMYQVEQTLEQPVTFVGLDEEFVRNTVAKPVAGKRLSERMYRDRNKLARQSTGIIRAGLVNGDSYAVIAKGISQMTEANYFQAVRIARTEGGRLRSLGTHQSQQECKELGVDIKKMWHAALDSRTRSSHGSMDGQTVDVDEPFKSPSGGEAMAPRMFGIASEDINCRCTSLSVIDGIAPSARTDMFGETVYPYENYNQWKERRADDIAKFETKDKTNKLINKAKDAEKQVTKDLKEITEAHGTELAGLKYKIKSKESLARKISNEPYSKMRDVLRYTEVGKPDDLAKKTTETIEKLKEKGYNVSAFKNYWNVKSNPYNGINANFITPEGYEFELQFHTQESFDIKNGELHKLYEKQRILDPEKDTSEIKALKKQMRKLYENVTVPNGIYDL